MNVETVRPSLTKVFFMCLILKVISLVSIVFTEFSLKFFNIKLHNSSINLLQNHLNFYHGLILVLVGPFFEEIVFRLGIVFSKVNFAILVMANFYFIQHLVLKKDLYEVDFENFEYVLLSFIIYVVTFKLLSNKNNYFKTKIFWEKHSKAIFYLFIIYFGFVHIFNFEIDWKLLKFIPIIVLPQITTGFFFAHNRLKYGFWLVFILHSFLNFSFFIFQIH